MKPLLDHLEEVIEHTRARVASGLGEGRILTASDDEVTRALSLAAELQRLTDAVMIETVGEVSRRSIQRDRDLRLTSKMGCHDVGELVERLTLLGPSSAARLQRAARPTMVRVSLAGTPLPGMLPAIHDALVDGAIGLDGVLAAAGPLESMGRHVSHTDLLTADGMLAAAARGDAATGAPPACAELLKIQAQTWAAYLDQDGAEPREQKALRERGITLGRARDGIVPISGNLLAEVAKQFDLICHAIGNPRVDQDGPVVFRPSDDVDDPFRADSRTPAQKRHDALATALFTAASSRLLPTIGGAAPTLVVSVREQDLATGRGWAHVDGEPVSLQAAAHAGCAGTVQRVLLGENGRIMKLGIEERVFNRHQRRAIALRDGGCLIPGCGVPAAWCEIHHVHDHALGGRTHTDNGVLLCWYHHRHLSHHGWQIRIADGVPEVKAPPWVERTPRWRPATTSPTRLLDTVRRRT